MFLVYLSCFWFYFFLFHVSFPILAFRFSRMLQHQGEVLDLEKPSLRDMFLVKFILDVVLLRFAPSPCVASLYRHRISTSL